MKISCNISDNAIYDYSENERYSLGIKGDNPLICIGFNPSTACPNNYDNTIRRLIGIVENNIDYDSWIMLNIYPQRATDPNNLDEELNEDIHKYNLQIIKRYIKDNSRILCSWGTSIDEREYLGNCLIDIYDGILSKKQNVRYFHIGELTRGRRRHPRHILSRERIDYELREFDMDGYINRLRMRQAG
jgi:hypothetical protein